jgi:hypothetical protein
MAKVDRKAELRMRKTPPPYPTQSTAYQVDQLLQNQGSAQTTTVPTLEVPAAPLAAAPKLLQAPLVAYLALSLYNPRKDCLVLRLNLEVLDPLRVYSAPLSQTQNYLRAACLDQRMSPRAPVLLRASLATLLALIPRYLKGGSESHRLEGSDRVRSEEAVEEGGCSAQVLNLLSKLQVRMILPKLILANLLLYSALL